MRQWIIDWYKKICFSVMNIVVNLFVKGKSIPSSPVRELHIDPNRPVLYILPYQSQIDLIVVRQLTRKLQLPDPLSTISVNGHTYPSLVFVDSSGAMSAKQTHPALSTFHDLLVEQQKDPRLDVQLLMVTVMFNRKPNREGKKKITLQKLNSFHRLLKIFFYGYDCYAQFSPIVSLKKLVKPSDNIEVVVRKLVRAARIHFARQLFAAVGPELLNHHAMIHKLLNSATLKEAIHEEAKNKNISIDKAYKQAHNILSEIAAKFTYWMLHITNLVLTLAWRYLYQGLKINNIDAIRQLAKNGHEIVYVPCHRSHMDYLLLSYVLYRQGLVPPHIAAGINLNFWPAGPIFRRLGAFFIRRSFRGNKLYTTVFKEYLAELFMRGYPVEYFIEGKRSRTGLLLRPKTGLLMMTIQTMLRCDPRPITLVPVYIGYEHVLELKTYVNELRGASKKKENFWQTIKAFLELKKLGCGYVNFGEPISLNQFLNYYAPNWQNIEPVDVQKPSWLTPTTNQLADRIMENINRAAAINPINLCCAILLNSKNNTLSKMELITQIDYLLSLLRNVPYDRLVTIPDNNAYTLLEQALAMKKFIYSNNDGNKQQISLSPEQAIFMNYYRNNICHLLIIPALIARVIVNNSISRQDLISSIKLLYPFIKTEFFLSYNNSQLTLYVNNLLNELIQLGLIKEHTDQLHKIESKKRYLLLLAIGADDSLKRYVILFSLLRKKPMASRSDLEKDVKRITAQLLKLSQSDSNYLVDKELFPILINALREQNLLSNGNDQNARLKLEQAYQLSRSLVADRLLNIIENQISVKR